MKQQPKQDLRYLKNENLIRETFRKMICEMDYSKISIKELAQRAQINRKTFYLHYSSLDHLLAVLQLEIMEPTVQMISETKFPEDAEIIIKKSFEIMASLDWADKKILSTKGDLPEKKGPSDLIREQLFQKYDHLAQYSPFESSLILTYFSVCLGVIFRQWEANSQQIPIEEMIQMTTKMILHGLEGVGLVPEENDGF
ncbi:MAG TPA: TetR family transcriptional regulator [Candidatus Blautia stercoripullorum]|uniref:TetR family transcriptional regulator n=1 Tax=Candidatus Blautia stercoripullorum TaxID=2838502 RepID=A0A9D2U4W9_9FIRM|nr:TetR family transcriptional regulator [Candidatus Blautia stercoripullorum]